MGQIMKHRHGVMLLTVPVYAGQDVKYLGLVTGQAVIGANFIRDFFASITDFLGGRSRSYEKPLEAAIEAALDDLARTAADAGANAVLGVSLDTNQVGQGMLMCSASGSAVVLS